jgi:hypothetical protein
VLKLKKNNTGATGLITLAFDTEYKILNSKNTYELVSKYDNKHHGA